jgi:hypothetical protein
MNHNPVVLEMRNLHFVIGIVVILALVCSPALADFRATDWRQSHSSLPEKKSHLPTILVPTPTPTTTPTPDENNCYHRCPVLLYVTSTPTRAFVSIDGSNRGLTPISIGDLSVGTHQLRVSRIGYETYSTEIVIPEPSWWCGCQSCLAGDWRRGVCKVNDISINVTLKKIESTKKTTIPTIIPSPTPTPAPAPYTDEEWAEMMDKWHDGIKRV